MLIADTDSDTESDSDYYSDYIVTTIYNMTILVGVWSGNPVQVWGMTRYSSFDLDNPF